MFARVLERRRSWAWLVVLVAAGSGCVAPPERADAVWVRIPAGATLEAAAESLAAYGIVTSADRFVRYARAGRRHRDIKPGIYPLRPGTHIGKVLVTLRRGRPPAERVVVRERMTVGEVAFEVERWLGIPAQSLVDAVRDSALVDRLGAAGESVEGYLYPTVYYVNQGASARDVIRQMADTFVARWKPAWDARLDSLGLSRHQAVTLASIIAGEMPHPETDERFRMSSVYHNRLARGMRLQADPTVVYALGRRRRLSFGDYRIESAYNTYAIAGLPPGPISQPSASSIEAALYPADTDYLYFVARPDGRHEFSRTYREHLDAIQSVRGR